MMVRTKGESKAELVIVVAMPLAHRPTNVLGCRRCGEPALGLHSVARSLRHSSTATYYFVHLS
jgi:hypothetical protein